MSKNLKIFLGISYILILFTFLYFIFSYLEISRLNDFLYYKQLQIDLDRSVSSNLFLNLLFFFLFCLIWISLLGFGSPLLIISGILFGKWIGTFISIISISAGALLLYIIANYFFRDLVNSLFKKKFSRYVSFFKKNEFYYFFAFRLLGGFGIPFGLQNILPVIFNIKNSNYFFASLFGFIPMFFIWNTVGAGLNDYIKNEEKFSLFNVILSKEIYTPLILFAVIIVSTALIRKKIFRE